MDKQHKQFDNRMRWGLLVARSVVIDNGGDDALSVWHLTSKLLSGLMVGAMLVLLGDVW